MHHPSADDGDRPGEGGDGPGAGLLTPGTRRVLPWAVLGTVAVILLAVVLSVPLGGRVPTATPGGSGVVVIGGSPLLGKPAPSIALEDLDGHPVALADFAGRPVIVNIWASWCVPCRGEFPMLVGAYGAYRDQGLQILGIVHADTAANARAFAQQQGAAWPMLLDSKDAVWHDYIGVGVPQSYFIDGDGIVRSFSLGPFTADGLAAGLAAILPATSSPGGSAP